MKTLRSVNTVKRMHDINHMDITGRVRWSWTGAMVQRLISRVIWTLLQIY